MLRQHQGSGTDPDGCEQMIADLEGRRIFTLSELYTRFGENHVKIGVDFVKMV